MELLAFFPRKRLDAGFRGLGMLVGSSLKKDLPELRCCMLMRKHRFERKLVTWFTSGAVD